MPAEPRHAVVKHAVVTGASSGIGLAICRQLRAEGWRVTGMARRASPLDGVKSVQVDLADIPAALAALDEAGPIDAFIHAAGFLRSGDLGGLNPADLAAMWTMHVAVPEALVNRIAPAMQAGGRIVLIGSRTSSGQAGKSQYAATKAALNAMVQTYAAETATTNVKVNGFNPGPTRTRMYASGWPGADQSTLASPEDVAKTIVPLCLPDCAVSGQVYDYRAGKFLAFQPPA